MKRFPLIAILLAAVVTAAFIFQGQDPSGLMDAKASIPAGVVLTPPGVGPIVNVAVTGATVDRSGYASAMMLVNTGIVDNVATIGYVVLQDSSVIPAQVWTVSDSILVDSTDSKQYKVTYRGTRRYLRCLQRATQAAADSLFESCLIVMVGKRVR